MKKSAWIIALFAAFALAAIAQDPSSSSDQGTNSNMGQPASGQTETSGIVAINRIADADITGEVRSVPIGRPIANTEILLLDVN